MTNLEKDGLSASWNLVRTYWNEVESPQNIRRRKELEEKLVPSFKFNDSLYKFEDEYLNGKNPIGLEYLRISMPDSFNKIGSGWNFLFLEPGWFIISVFKVHQLWRWNEEHKFPQGHGLLLLVKNEEEYRFEFFGSQNTNSERNIDKKHGGLQKNSENTTKSKFSKINNRMQQDSDRTEECTFPQIKIGRRNWIHRHKDTVSLNLGDSGLISFQFREHKKAISCEKEIYHYLKSSIDQKIVRIYGDCLEDQLHYYNFLRCENRKDQLKLIREVKTSTRPSNWSWWDELFSFTSRTETEISNKAPNLWTRIVKIARVRHNLQKNDEVNFSLRECICQRAHHYLVKTCASLNPLFRTCIDSDMNLKQHCENVLSDLKTLRTIVPFCSCGDRKGHLSSRDLMEMMENTMALIQTCQKFNEITELYQNYKKEVTWIRDYVEELLKNPDDFPPLLSEIEATGQFSALISNVEKKRKNPHANRTLNKLKSTQSFNLILRMCSYLSMEDYNFLLFDELDRKLRIGEEESLFMLRRDNVSRELQSLKREAERLKNYCETVFIKPNIFIPGKNEEDWSLVSGFDSTRKMDKKRISECLPLILLKIEDCKANLDVLLEPLEIYLNFNIADWKALREIRKQLGPAVIHNREYSEASSSSESDSESKPVDEKWKEYNHYFNYELQLKGEVGHGAYGAVSICNHESLGKVAIKQYHYCTKKEDIKKEIDMLIRLQSNDHIVRLLGFFRFCEADSHILGIIMEFIERNLHDFIHDVKEEYTLDDSMLQMKGLASAFWCMHNQGIIHRDIKPQNILLKDRTNVQICDFGTSSDLKQTFRTELRGTRAYMSPEIIEEEEHDAKTDVYSLAITMWEMLHRRIPFEDIRSNSRLMNMVVEGKRPEFDEKCPRLMVDLITSAWDPRPTLRPNMSSLKKELHRLLGTLSNDVLKTLVKSSEGD